MNPSNLAAEILRRRGMEPFAFQEEAWRSSEAGRSGVIVVPTGSGKTLAAALVPMLVLAARRGSGQTSGTGKAGRAGNAGLGLLYISPLRAVARDITRALQEINQSEGLGLRVEERTGDTSGYRKRKQLDDMPDVLLTTPESASLLLSHPGRRRRFAGLHTVVVDEWHELLGNKRGVLLQLTLSAIRASAPEARVWGLSATIAEPETAARALVGRATEPLIIAGAIRREPQIEALVPAEVDSFPWGGHLGLQMRDLLLQRLDPETSTLIFTNTRNQAERWYTALSEAASHMDGRIGLHHGSIQHELRSDVEERLRDGRIRWVLATSSLDLGIDFRPVDQVVQIGSAKSLARLLQRAGRSGHRPGAVSRIILVPTHALELLEMLALQRAVESGQLEPRQLPQAPLDVLVQHLCTLAAGDGVDLESSFSEISGTESYRSLTRERFADVLALLQYGGKALAAYERYRKLVPDQSGRLVFAEEAQRRLHRMNIGTITANPSVKVAFTNGRVLGEVEEGFVSRLRRGDVFFFAGKTLEYVLFRGDSLRVRSASSTRRIVPGWPGGRLPISESMGEHLRAVLAEWPGAGQTTGGDWTRAVRTALGPLMQAQAELSGLPAQGETLAEIYRDSDYSWCFVFPFAGSRVHEGMASLLAMRLARAEPASYFTSWNDYGFLVRSSGKLGPQEICLPELFSPEGLEADLREALNTGDMARVEFREVAQIGGLVQRRIPGHELRLRQIHSSASLLFDVLAEHDPEHPLYREAFRSALQRQLDLDHLERGLARISSGTIRAVQTHRPSPLAFPLYVSAIGGSLSTEDLRSRLARLIRGWEEAKSS